MSNQRYDVADWAAPAMGGMLAVAVAAEPGSMGTAELAAERVGRRVTAWANRLTRFQADSDLSRLNADRSPAVRVRPTLGSALDWARTACAASAGVVDVTMLDARLAAEHGDEPSQVAANGAQWSIECSGRRVQVTRSPGVHFDLDGVAKGWLADRASWLLIDWPGCFIDADGDVALAAGSGVEWLIDVADPHSESAPPLATFRFLGTNGWRRTAGVATSGTSVHRWTHPGGRSDHHLIDPRSGRPAETDVVQATVVAPTAREAEVLAKAALILGTGRGLRYLAKSAAHAAVLLLESGEVVSSAGTERWLA
jgi:thiamine biosynthesis lipoprotein